MRLRRELLGKEAGSEAASAAAQLEDRGCIFEACVSDELSQGNALVELLVLHCAEAIVIPRRILGGEQTTIRLRSKRGKSVFDDAHHLGDLGKTSSLYPKYGSLVAGHNFSPVDIDLKLTGLSSGYVYPRAQSRSQ